MSKYYNDWYIEFVYNAITEREKKIEKLQREIKVFAEERNRINKKELSDFNKGE